MLKFKKKGHQFSNLLRRVSKTFTPIEHCFDFLEITTCIRSQPCVIKVIRFISSSLLFFFGFKLKKTKICKNLLLA